METHHLNSQNQDNISQSDSHSLSHKNLILQYKALEFKHSKTLNELDIIKSTATYKLHKKIDALINKLTPPNSLRYYFYSKIISMKRIFFGWTSSSQNQTTLPAIDSDLSIKNLLKKLGLDSLHFNRKKFSFEQPLCPQVSILILAHNNLECTMNCLYSIFKSVISDLKYEVLLIDNASSSDFIKTINKKFKGIIILKNDTNLGFSTAYNLAAKKAKGKFLFFLNNDTLFTPNCLKRILETFEDSKVGAAGAKLLYPDERLQEAGSAVFQDGSAINIGKGKNPNLSEFSFLRKVDYCSAAALMVRKSLFESVGGFNLNLDPAY